MVEGRDKTTHKKNVIKKSRYRRQISPTHLSTGVFRPPPFYLMTGLHILNFVKRLGERKPGHPPREVRFEL